MSSAPQTPPYDPLHEPGVLLNMADMDFLNELSAPTFSPQKFRRRDAPLDPFILAAALSSGPHITHHHHFHHNLMPIGEDDDDIFPAAFARQQQRDPSPRPSVYVSKQKPRTERLREEAALSQSHSVSLKRDLESQPETDPAPRASVAHPDKAADVHGQATDEVLPPENARHAPPPHASSLAVASPLPAADALPSSPTHHHHHAVQATAADQGAPSRAPLQVSCRARTRVPTPHGQIFLHLYHNNWDNKEHLAIVIDSAQLDVDVDADADAPPTGSAALPAPIRSTSLEAQWHERETEMERITRGAYVGRLTATKSRASVPTTRDVDDGAWPAPMVRIHSECFTGETIGSMRCDCGEQLDEAMRLIAQPVVSPSSGKRIPGRGAVIYMRQEGRGIGLLEKIRAYNLQDLGHDTVTANLLLGHGADERGYEIAAAIMKDLGLGGKEAGVQLLTNNPDKLEALQKEGVRVVGRVPMVPRSWRRDNDSLGRDGRHSDHEDANSTTTESYEDYELRRAGATLIGGGAAHGVELERYLRTKVQRMGHMLELPSSPSGSSTAPVTPPSEDNFKMLSGTASMASLPELVSDSETEA